MLHPHSNPVHNVDPQHNGSFYVNPVMVPKLPVRNGLRGKESRKSPPWSPSLARCSDTPCESTPRHPRNRPSCSRLRYKPAKVRSHVGSKMVIHVGVSPKGAADGKSKTRLTDQARCSLD